MRCIIAANLSRRWRDSRSSAILNHASGVTASYPLDKARGLSLSNGSTTLTHLNSKESDIFLYSKLYTLHSTLLPDIFVAAATSSSYENGNPGCHKNGGQQIPNRQLPYSQYVQTNGENEKPASGVHLGYNRLGQKPLYPSRR